MMTEARKQTKLSALKEVGVQAKYGWALNVVSIIV